MVENIPGHIVELGVGAVRNAIVLGHLLKLNSQHGNLDILDSIHLRVIQKRFGKP